MLHCLGLVLNFRDHPILKNTNVLKPKWVTEGIYVMLSDKTLKNENKGIFNLDDLTRVLDATRYPSDQHNYLIELMKEFELCFDIDCNPKQFLIPAILPKDEPAETELEGDTLEFQYHYRILPNSIISRFIVKISNYIHNQTYWRSGVMLAYYESGEVYNIARIKADSEDKKIFIAISGRKETRRSFLSIIRGKFQEIHRNFFHLDISEWVLDTEHPSHPPLDYQELLGLEAMGRKEYPRGKLKHIVNIRKLLDGYATREDRQQSDRSLDKLDASRPIEIKIETLAMSGNHYNNNLTNTNIGNFGNEFKGSQQATNFTQTSGANIADILQLINNLRQTAEQFPPNICEELIFNIEDVEIEVQKPEKERNLAKLRNRLLSLVTAATVTFTAIAGMTDFANNVMEISNKLGIELVKL